MKHLRTTFVKNISFLCIWSGILAGSARLYNGLYVSGISGLIFAFLGLVAYKLHGTKLSVAKNTILLACFFMSAVAQVYSPYSSHSPILAAPLVVALGLFLLDKKWGTIWTFSVIARLLIVYLLQDFNLIPIIEISENVIKLQKYAAAPILIFIMAFIVLKFNQMTEAKISIHENILQERTKFFASISHEIRTPLNAIIGSLKLIELNKNSETQQKELHSIMKSNSEILNSVINDFLNFSKQERNLFHTKLMDTDIYNILENCVHLYKLNALENNTTLRLLIDKNIPRFIHTDGVRLNQVIINLVSNSIKFTRNGYIVVEATIAKNQKNIIIQVIDNGLGIHESDLKNIFEPFTMGNNNKKVITNGSGLGLAICVQIVESLGGKIKIDSQESTGTTVTVTIPLQLALTQKLQSMKNEIEIPYNTSIKALVVDDNHVNTKILSRFLDHLLIKHIVAENGIQALDLFDQHDIDIILMDIQMPELNGIEATRIIKKSLKGQQVKVIALSANTLDDQISECYASGMEGFIAKPVKIDELRTCLEKFFPLNIIN